MSTPDKVIIEADGGSRGNPGPAGYGAVVFDADSRSVLAERKEFIGTATNNVAEYKGLIAGLTAASEIGAREVDVRMDSKLIVEQMSGRWKVKHPDMIPLAREAATLARAFTSVKYTWIPREKNKHADKLANEAMDAAAEGRDEEPPAAKPAAYHSPGWTGAMGTPTRMLLLRHGQTALSVERRYSGRGDHPLTSEGQRQVETAAQRLSRQKGRISAVISSPLTRTRSTADAAAEALGLPVTPHDGLIETDFGAWEGLTFTEASARDPELFARWLTDTSVEPPGGESFDTVHKRVRRARDELIAEYGGANLLIVSHVTPIKTVLRMALDAGPALLFRLHLDLASLSIAEFYPDGGASVKLVNDTSHTWE
ncbi:bifunctional RNase H/acid phosphatase [Hoyosella rhizosphaerae]|uniref:Bifunctional RNase H/acid phosphatase n=1 Tax=Hoyosella rhizosphaerae TaxID=1755582 RepID=A0A916XH37_9ACTN|nr:bifunctional RNase H/acid phosphatase [Hoyosella rhizosphaerae]MBN4927996.1 bifunctional RNase H/acid phosphatase [Hoyosella rhizosphaerae]GGC71567.1 bifunctional RNase H/acid phosphatase [Hoyosella rhizosphaerae]